MAGLEEIVLISKGQLLFLKNQGAGTVFIFTPRRIQVEERLELRLMLDFFVVAHLMGH
jgi:hypothetical protein